MNIMTSKVADRPMPTDVNSYRVSHSSVRLDSTKNNILALNKFKEFTQAAAEHPRPHTDTRNNLPIDLAESLLEELKQARFREARRLKRIETLELEVKVTRAQNDALRAALETARCATTETIASGAEAIIPATVTTRPLHDTKLVPPHKLRRYLNRLIHNRR